MHGLHIVTVGFLIGASSSLFWLDIPSIVFISLLFLSSNLFVFAFKWRLLGGILLGMAWMGGFGWVQYSKLFPESVLSSPLVVTGQVESLIAAQNNIRFTLALDSDEPLKYFYSRNLRLSWLNPPWRLKQGQRVELTVKLKPPHGIANQGGFIYQRWLLSESIIATGYVTEEGGKILDDNHLSIRQALFDKFMLLDLSQQRWILALSLGYRGLLTKQDWQLLQDTGLAHIMAISGMHLVILYSFSFVIFSKFSAICFSVLNRQSKISSFVVGVVGALVSTGFYANLSGFNIPVARAWIGVLIVVGMTMSGRYLTQSSSYILGAFCLVLLFPASLFSLSLWLSVSAVAIVLFCLWRWPINVKKANLFKKLKVACQYQLVMSLMISPVIAFSFQVFPIYSVLFNLVTVPILTFLLLPLSLVAISFFTFESTISVYLFQVINRMFEVLMSCLFFFSDFIELAISLPQIGLLPMPPLPLNKVWFLPLLLPALFELKGKSSHVWEVTILDVGQGLSVLIEKNNQVVVYDTGASYPSGFNMAQSAVIPFLRTKGIDKIDFLVLSHEDNDHSGGKFILSPFSRHIVDTNAGCYQGNDWQWQGLNFEVLWPPKQHDIKSSNGRSCVIKIDDGRFSVVLPGDIGVAQEKELVALYGNQLSSDVLVVPHHGSASSSSANFIKAVSPKWAVFSRGFRNRWGFPKAHIERRFTDHNVILYDTANSGQITFNVGEETIYIETYRQDINPYWHTNFPK